MKKLLLLLFLFSVTIYGQEPTGDELNTPTGIRNRSAPEVSDAPYIVTASIKGVYGKNSPLNLPIPTKVQDSLDAIRADIIAPTLQSALNGGKTAEYESGAAYVKLLDGTAGNRKVNFGMTNGGNLYTTFLQNPYYSSQIAGTNVGSVNASIYLAPDGAEFTKYYGAQERRWKFPVSQPAGNYEFAAKSDLTDFVSKSTPDVITATKNFEPVSGDAIYSKGAIVVDASVGYGSAIAVRQLGNDIFRAGDDGLVQINTNNAAIPSVLAVDVNDGLFTIGSDGTNTAKAHVTTGGTSSQTVKGDGSLDSTKYAEFYKTVPRTGKYYSGKTIYWFGDSYTSGSGASTSAKRHSTLVSNALGATETNFGVAGTTMQKRVPINYMAGPNMVDNVVNIPTKTANDNKAMLVFGFGLNDMGQTAAAYTTANYKTDYQTVINSAISKGWDTRDILIIPAYYIGSAGYAAYATITGNAAPTQARHLDFIQAAKEVSETNGTMYFDIYQDQLRNNTSLLVADNIHPNDAGYYFIASDILQYLGQPQLGSNPFTINGTDIKPVDISNRVYLGTSTASGVTTPNGRLNLGGQYNITANDPANAKLVITDGGATNIYGFGTSGPNGLEVYGGATGANKITLFGNAFFNNKATVLGNLELSGSASPDIRAIQNSTSGAGGIFSQNSSGAYMGFRQNGSGVGSLPNLGVFGSETGFEIISNFTSTSGGTGNIVLRQGGTASTNTLAISPLGLYIQTTPTTSPATFDILTRNTSSGLVEKRTISKASATLDFPSTAGGASADLTMTVTGAVVGNPVVLGVGNTAYSVTNSMYSAWVSATNTVTVRLMVVGITAKDPASDTFKVEVLN